MSKCMNCGHEIYWSSDFMRSEVEGWDYDKDNPVTDENGSALTEDDDTVINFCHCPECHADIEFWHLSPNEAKNYKFEDEQDRENDGCFACAGGNLIEDKGDNDELIEMYKEMASGEEGEEPDVKIYRCTDCGAKAIYIIPKENENEKVI